MIDNLVDHRSIRVSLQTRFDFPNTFVIDMDLLIYGIFQYSLDH